MAESVKSFQFRADGSRAPSGDAPHPHHFSLGMLASLYEAYRAGDWLPGALVRMCEFGHPRIRTNPKHFIFKANDSDEVEIMEPYDHYRDGPRCVLGDAEAHQEWKKRRSVDYQTRDELLNREELRSYAETGDIPREGLAAFSLMPSPPTVVIDSKQLYKGQLHAAHREFKIEIKANLDVNEGNHWGSHGFHLFKHLPDCARRLNKKIAYADDDPGCARGYVESAMRRRIALEDNTFPLSMCSFEIRKQAYMANRESILQYKSRELGKAVNDNHASLGNGNSS